MCGLRQTHGVLGVLILLTLVAMFNSKDVTPKHSVAAGENATRPKDKNDRTAAKSALSQFQDLVGGWNGAGQPKRGSNVGAWLEKGEWLWKFDGELTALEYRVEKGKLLTTALLTFDPKTKSYQLKTTEPVEGKSEPMERQYRGTLSEKKLVFDSLGDDDPDSRRITVTRLNEKRTLILFERKVGGQNFYSRVAEVGYTREGTRLADSDQTGPECVVTGGAGTIKVNYKAETYWVCCTGCRDAFNDDPEGVLADYRKRLEERKAKK